MASHGAFVGVTLVLVWFARKTKVSFLHLGDLITSTAALGLILGRIANFINGELWGKESTVSWAVIFANTGGGPLFRSAAAPILRDPIQASQFRPLGPLVGG